MLNNGSDSLRELKGLSSYDTGNRDDSVTGTNFVVVPGSLSLRQERERDPSNEVVLCGGCRNSVSCLCTAE